MDNLYCDLYSGKKYPKYMQDNQQLKDNMTFIYNVNDYLTFYKRKSEQAYFTKGIFDLILKNLKVSKF